MPEVVAPTNKVNVAFPFSTITVQQSNEDLAELAGIVTELSAAVEAVAPGPRISELRRQAQALAARSHR